MPISREEFERSDINRARRILELLSSHRERAYTAEDLLQALNFRLSDDLFKSSRDWLGALGDNVQTSRGQLLQALDVLIEHNFIRSKTIEGEVYFTTELGHGS